MGAGPLQIITVGVSSLEESVSLFRDVIGLQVEAEYEADQELLVLWGLEPGTSAMVSHLSYQGYPSGQLRLIQYEPPATVHVRSDDHGEADSASDVGPKAIDFYVNHDLETAITEMRKAGYEPRSRPIHYIIGPTETEELLFTGPDGLPILLMVAVDHPESSHRKQPEGARYSEIATVSVISADQEATRSFYEGVLGMNMRSGAEVGPELLDIANELVDVPKGTRMHFAVFNSPPDPSGKYLLIHFFEGTGSRLEGRMRPGHLGISLYTHDVDDLAVFVAAAGPEAVVAGPTEARVGEERYRIAILAGPNEERFELRERL